MLKNYLKTAISNIRGNKYFSILNILGLALGISISMVIITIIDSQFSYDNFHPHVERTYRVNTRAIRKNQSTEDYATSPVPLGNYLKSNYPFVEDAVNLTGGLSGDAGIDDKTIFINGFFSNKAFFNVFGFNLLYGDKSTALNSPKAIVLTNQTATKLFGKNVNPVGRVLQVKGLENFIITGVFEEPKGKTHLEFDALGSDQELGALEKANKIFNVGDNWANYYSNYTYILLKAHSNPNLLKKSLIEISRIKYTGKQLESLDKGYEFYLQAVDKIAPGPILTNNMGKALPEDLLWYLSLIGFVVILAAGFNYNSLSLASALGRSKEIGIRKSFGAQKYQVFVQFLVQSVLTSLISLLFASLLFHFVLRPFFENIDFFKTADIILYETPNLYLLFLLFTILVGAIAGIFPSVYLSSLNPVKALKENSNFSSAPKIGFRKGLLTLQFAIALLFVVGLINIYRQTEYVMHADYGFRRDQIINIDLQGDDYLYARQAFTGIKGVLDISGSSHSIGTTRDEAVDTRVNAADERERIRDFTIDENYLDNFKLHLLAGKNFVRDLSGKELYIIVNEAFLRYFHLGNPGESLGKRVILGDNINVTISGVLKDFNYQPLTKEIAPVIFRYNTSAISQLNILVDKKDIPGTLHRLNKTWRGFDNTNLFKYSFLTDEMQQAYANIKDIPKLLTVVAMITIIVASLGLLGLAVFLLKQRIKEISVRKILGANVIEITLLLSKGFLYLVVGGILIGLPVGVFLDTMFMNNFSAKVDPLWGYLLAVAFLLTMVILSIGIQIIKTARTNPIIGLRVE